MCIHICWFDFNALAQGNVYKPTKEPINYRGPGGDRTHDLQTEATPPAASCPARSFHATTIVSKTQSYWHARCCTGQLTTRLECTAVNFNIRVYTQTYIHINPPEYIHICPYAYTCISVCMYIQWEQETAVLNLPSF